MLAAKSLGGVPFLYRRWKNWGPFLPAKAVAESAPQQRTVRSATAANSMTAGPQSTIMLVLQDLQILLVLHALRLHGQQEANRSCVEAYRRLQSCFPFGQEQRHEVFGPE